MRKILALVDKYLLFTLTAFLLAFIPLFPKIPLFDVLPGYIVRARLEDLLIGVVFAVWLVQLWRKKNSFGPNPLTRPILIYLTIGILSMISAVFISQTVPLQSLHIMKMALHFLRRIEYFSLFFVFYSTVKTLKQVKVYIGILVVTMLLVTLYGYGQKYLYWPAFSTMNREFSKGWALYLTQHARVLSTFGGHYDLAAFTMMMLLLLWALFFSTSRLLLKFVIFTLLGGAFWLLILTASRTSFLAYIAGVTILFGMWMFRRGILWSVTRWFAVVVSSVVIMLSFGDLSERFTKLLKIDQRLSGIKSLLLQPIGVPPNGNNIALLENNIAAVTSKSDFPPLPKRPTDVNTEIPDGFIATQSATGAAITKEIPRVYSQAALVYDLSTGIRLDALWPQAIKGFLKNPLLGSGYSTLSKSQVTEFTEAESTDNDFLRALGETGLLGFISFGWILVTVLIILWKAFTAIEDKTIFAVVIVFAAIIVGLLVNAVYIDIFEASKVALSFWALTGIILGSIKVLNIPKQNLKIPPIPDMGKMKNLIKNLIRKTLTSDKTYLAIIVLLAFVVRQYRIHEPLADWHSWRQSDTSSVTRNFVRYGVNLFYPRYDDLSSIPSGKPNPEGYRFVEFPLYNAVTVVVDKMFPGFTIEYSGRLTSIFASLGTLVVLFFLTKKYFGIKTGLITGLLFALLPYNIFWSRTILPEPMLVFLCVSMLYFFDRWLENEKLWEFLLSLIFATSGLLLKFSVAFFIFPIVYLAWKKWKRSMFIQPMLLIYGLVAVAPFIWWRWHIAKYPEGIPAYDWLFNGDGIRFKGAWFWWLFAERMSKLIMGGWGVGLFVLGLVIKPHESAKKTWMFHLWMFGMIVYLVVFATGNVRHDYYQIILVPILIIFMARGVVGLIDNKNNPFHSILAKFMAVCLVVFTLMFGWYQARDLFNINHKEIVEAGQEFDRTIANLNVRVIAPYGGDTAFLYQTGRRGWPIMEGSIDDMLLKGADYYISVTQDDLTKKLEEEAKSPADSKHEFKIIKQTDKFVIIQLVSDKILPKP